MCPAVVSCATADEESGSSLKLGYCVDQPLCYSVQKNWFWKCFLSNETLHKISLSAKVNLNLTLDLPCAWYSVYTPCVGVVELAEYVCTHPILFFYRRRSRLCTWRRWVGAPSCTQPCLWIWVTCRSYRMAQDSDDFLFIFNIVACVWIVFLAIVALLCSLPRLLNQLLLIGQDTD